MITVDPDILGGVPVFKGTRVPVKTLFEYLEDNYSLEEFLECFPSVTRDMACRILERSENALLAPAYWLGRLAGRLTEGAAVVLFSGTVPTLGAALRYGDGFRMSLVDPRLGRSIVHEYDVALVDNPLA